MMWPGRPPVSPRQGRAVRSRCGTGGRCRRRTVVRAVCGAVTGPSLPLLPAGPSRIVEAGTGRGGGACTGPSSPSSTLHGRHAPSSCRTRSHLILEPPGSTKAQPPVLRRSGVRFDLGRVRAGHGRRVCTPSLCAGPGRGAGQAGQGRRSDSAGRPVRPVAGPGCRSWCRGNSAATRPLRPPCCSGAFRARTPAGSPAPRGSGPALLRQRLPPAPSRALPPPLPGGSVVPGAQRSTR